MSRSPEHNETSLALAAAPVVAHDTASPASASAAFTSTSPLASSAARSTRFRPSRSGSRGTHLPSSAPSRSSGSSVRPQPSSDGAASESAPDASTDGDAPPPTAAPNPIPFGVNATGSWALSTSKRPYSSHSAPRPTISAKIGPGLLNATLPDRGLVQCQPAIIDITAEANQSVAVTVIDYHNVLQRLDVTIPPPVKIWNWTAVDFPAGTELRIELAVGGGDVSSPQWASWVEMSHVHLGADVTSCLDAGDVSTDAPIAAAQHHSRPLGTLLGVTIPLVLVVGLVGAMVGAMILRRKRERKDRAALASDPATQLQDWQDRASMMWENSSRGLMRHTADPHLGRRAASLDSSASLAPGGLHISEPESPFNDTNQEDRLPTYKQSQRESRRMALPTYTRASTFTRATPSHLNRTTTYSSIHLGPLPLRLPAEHDNHDAVESIQDDVAGHASSNMSSHEHASDARVTRASSCGSSGSSLSSHREMSNPFQPHP